MNVSAVTVSDIKTTGDGRKVLDTIQRAIDKANTKAQSKQHKVSRVEPAPRKGQPPYKRSTLVTCQIFLYSNTISTFEKRTASLHV